MLRGWRLFFLLYVLILSISFIFELTRSDHKQTIISSGTSNNTALTLLFFPDLEGNSSTLDCLKSSLKNRFQILEVDYDEIEFDTADYSASQYAESIKQYVDSNLIDNLSIVATGFGSVIASRFVQINSDKIQSLILLDPEGILEFELLGGYHLNKGVYSIATLISWSLENLTPDFGYFEKTTLSYQNSKTRLDSDLRTARSYFRAVNVPTLIINTSDSKRKKKEVSKEFNRLIKSSKMVSASEEHSWSELSLISQNFIRNNNSEVDQISVSKKIKSLLPFSNSRVIAAEGWLLTGLMLLIIFSTFFSEDLACIGAGLMVARGLMGFFPALAASFIGIFVGDILVYLSGKWFGKSATQKAPLKWFVSETDIERSKEWFQAKGPAIIIMSRFIPGTRFPTYFSAGVIGASFIMFISYFGIASLIWTPVLVGASMILGQELIYYFSIYQEYALVVLAVVVVLALITLKIVIPLFTYRGRRLLYGKLQRLIRWEFWSPFVLYTPIVIYALFLWIKFKKITIVTAANPGIAEGGFIHESKSEILDGIKSRENIAKYCLLKQSNSESEKLETALIFIKENSLSFPIVIKPDKGERGTGVEIIKGKKELKIKISSSSEDVILQEFIEGEEFGIFYYRYPNRKEGDIFSVTKKEKIFIIGDGTHTLEQLILRDSRAVCMAEIHFEKHTHDLFKIPEEGEKVQLVELGTHSKGSLFLDGGNLITKNLKDSLNKISTSFEGFYFGRYDIIAPTEQDLINGENLKVLEVNGVTSESTNIYDPEHNFLFALKTLMKQWKIAFEIGALNYKNGTKIPPFGHMLRLIFRN